MRGARASIIWLLVALASSSSAAVSVRPTLGLRLSDLGDRTVGAGGDLVFGVSVVLLETEQARYALDLLHVGKGAWGDEESTIAEYWTLTPSARAFIGRGQRLAYVRVGPEIGYRVSGPPLYLLQPDP